MSLPITNIENGMEKYSMCILTKYNIAKHDLLYTLNVKLNTMR